MNILRVSQADRSRGIFPQTKSTHSVAGLKLRQECTVTRLLPPSSTDSTLSPAIAQRKITTTISVTDHLYELLFHNDFYQSPAHFLGLGSGCITDTKLPIASDCNQVIGAFSRTRISSCLEWELYASNLTNLFKHKGALRDTSRSMAKRPCRSSTVAVRAPSTTSSPPQPGSMRQLWRSK